MPFEILGSLTIARPGWLLLLIPCGVLCSLLYNRINKYSPWDRLLPAALRRALLQREPGPGHAGSFLLLGMAWSVAVITLSGPVWESVSPAMRQNQSALIVVLDVSHNMLANDLAPSRLERARLKIRDLLQMRSDGQVALIAFAGSAHRVTPLSTDHATLTDLLNGLSPDIMPVSGSDLGAALALAEKMAAPLPPNSTQILLITGSIDSAQFDKLNEVALRLGRQLAILGAGTTEGAPVALPEGGFMRDNQGRILLPRLDNRALASIARRSGASYHDLTRNDSDLMSLLQPMTLIHQVDAKQLTERSDQGHWLILLLLPLAALGARRGWLGLLLCAVLLPMPAEASPTWADVWLRSDQQAIELLAEDRPADAAEVFEDPHWIAWALYQATDYRAAALAYEKLLLANPDDSQLHFNHATALAMSGALENALEAYEQTLTRAPDHAAARHNRSRIEALLEEQVRQAEELKQNDPNEEDDPGNNDNRQTENPSFNSSSTVDEAPGSERPDNNGKASPDSTAPHIDSGSVKADVARRTETAVGSAAGSEGAPALRTDTEQPVRPDVSDTAVSDSPAGKSEQNVIHQALEPEQQAALQQWLREVPDNPADLLRRKFLYQRLQQLEERSR
jgi:Ca-activated chloride channel family protein